MDNNIQGLAANNSYQPNITVKQEEGNTDFSEILENMEIVQKNDSDFAIAGVGEVGGLGLSSAAEEYLADLKSRFPNIHFEIKEKYTDDDIRNMSASMDKQIGCIMNKNLLEQMATDPDVREKYEGLLVKAEEDFNEIRRIVEEFQKNNEVAVADGWSYIVEEINGEFMYTVLDAQQEEIAAAKSLDSLLERLKEYLEKIQEEQAEEDDVYASIVYDM